jgi:hypothetical protein
MDILLNNMQFIKESSWKNMLEYSSKEELDQMQQFVASAGLSSHMMITCMKKD